MTTDEFAGRFDHTRLGAKTTAADILHLAEEGASLGCASLCVMPFWVAPLRRELGSAGGPTICTVVGFPLGAHTAEQKRREGAEALADGAREIDMVMNIGAFLSGDIRQVEREIVAVRQEAGSDDVVLKVILETSLLATEQIVPAANLAAAAGADYVKTSTGFSGGGATVADVRLLREGIPASTKIKASGGIASARQAIALLRAGADRIGASRSVAIVREFADGPSELFSQLS